MSDALLVENLTVQYGSTSVLWDINFSIPKGKMVGILGPNGAGKSSLLLSLLGLVPKVSAKVEFLGQRLDEARGRIAYVPQRSSVDWDFPITAFEVVLMGRYNKLGFLKWARSSDKQAAERALDLVGMSAYGTRQIRALSGGQQQRIFLARALLQDAELYFMDEPFAGVDMLTERALISLLDNLKLQGKTLFVVHHDLNTASHYFDWAILLNTCLIACGPVADVLTSENLKRAYGSGSLLIEEAARLSKMR